MPQPTVSDVHISAALTNIAVAYSQGATNFVADRVFPMVPVVHQTDKYFIWRKGDFFRDQAKKRASGVESVGMGLNLDQDSYSADVWGLHKDIGDQERANADPAVDIETTTTQALMGQQLIRRDRLFVSNYMAASVWGTTMTGQATADATHAVFWNDDANSDPISDIETGKITILQNTGFMPNTLVLGYPLYSALRKNPLVIDRIKYTQNAADVRNINESMLAALFDVDRVIVSRAVYNSAAEGAADSMQFIMGNDALLCYAAPTPGLMVPSAGYIFPWTGLTGLGTPGIRIYQIPMPWLGLNTVRIDSDMAFDMKRVATDLGYFFDDMIG